MVARDRRRTTVGPSLCPRCPLHRGPQLTQGCRGGGAGSTGEPGALRGAVWPLGDRISPAGGDSARPRVGQAEWVLGTDDPGMLGAQGVLKERRRSPVTQTLYRGGRGFHG